MCVSNWPGRERPWAQIGQLTLQILNVKLKRQRPRPSYSLMGGGDILARAPARGMSACNETTLGHVGSLRQVAASPQSVRCGERPLTVTNGQTCSPARRISEPDRAEGEAFPCIQLSPSCRKTFSIPEIVNTAPSYALRTLFPCFVAPPRSSDQVLSFCATINCRNPYASDLLHIPNKTSA